MEPPPTAPPSERDPIQLEHKVPTVILEHNDEIKHEMGPESPQMPKLKTIDLKKIMKEKKVAEATKEEDKDETDTPEMPVFQSDEGRLLSTKKIKPQKLSETGNEEKDESVTPEMPLFQSEEGKALLTNRKINTQKLQIQQQMENKENNKDEESPQLPHLNTYEAQVMLSSKKPTQAAMKK